MASTTFSSKFSMTVETLFKRCVFVRGVDYSYAAIHTVVLKNGIKTNGVWFQGLASSITSEFSGDTRLSSQTRRSIYTFKEYLLIAAIH